MNKPVNFESATVPGVINLGPGQPSSDLLPTQLLQQASEQFFAAAKPQDFNYGPKQGAAAFRDALATFLGDAYGREVRAQNLFLSAGNSQALDLVCERFTRPGDVVFVEKPTYFLAYGIFRDHGLEIVEVPTDGQGMDLDAFEALLALNSPRLVYTIPSFHNPTGQTMTLARRERLVELSRQHDFLIAADEVYQLLHYDQAPPPDLGSWAGQGNVLSLGSFSKILAPGLRLGWIETRPELMDTLLASGALSSGGSFNHFTSQVVCSAMTSGLQAEHLTHLRNSYRSRVDAMDRALHEHMSSQVQWTRPHGGYFFWLELRNGGRASSYRERASELKTGFMPGKVFTCSDGLDAFLRLSFAPFAEQDIREGVRRLAEVFSERPA